MLFMELTIRTEREGDTYTVAPSGELDIAASARSSNSAGATGPRALGRDQPSGFGGLRLELIECDGCGQHFATLDALEILAAITGVCATCAGTFRLAPDSVACPQTPGHADRVSR